MIFVVVILIVLVGLIGYFVFIQDTEIFELQEQIKELRKHTNYGYENEKQNRNKQ